ncbi:hypothetical protein Tco_0014944 [Tanacetum coccineum]
MGDKNPIRTLGGYSKPSHEGYRNTIELPVGNNVVPLRSDTIRLVQNGCSFHELWSEDPNQHLKDFLKLVDSLDVDGENRERIRMLVPTTLSIAWKIPNKPLLNMHPHVPMKREISDAKLSKFEADFKQQQSEMTNKIDTLLKAITDRITGALPSDTVKNPKLSTSLILSAHSYPIIDPQCSSHPSTSINAIKAHSKEAYISQTSLLRPGMEIKTQQPKEPETTLEDEFQDLHLNLPDFEILAHALIYNAILDKNVKSLELGKNGSTFVQ